MMNTLPDVAAAAPRASRAGLPLCGSGPDNVWQKTIDGMTGDARTASRIVGYQPTIELKPRYPTNADASFRFSCWLIK